MATIVNQRLASLRSLVVDDMAPVRQNIRTQLGQLGIAHVDQAATPDEAIGAIRRQSYDIIVCDYNLNRETNGQQVLEYVRSQGILSPASMFIMVTAESSYDFVASAAEFQPDAYMIKPLTGAKLLERIERLLDRQAALRPIAGRLALKDLPGAVAECDVAIQAQPKWALDIMKLKANALLDLGRPDEARAVYQKVLKVRDDIVWARLGLARCHQMAGELDAARKVAAEVLELNPRYVMAYDLLARVAETEGKEAEALEALNRSCEVVPSARRSRMVGDVAYRTGNLDQAKEAFSRALQQTRGSVTAQPGDLLTLAQVHVDTGDAKAALDLLGGAPKHYADAPQFVATRAAVQAQAHVSLGDEKAAQAAFEAAREAAGAIEGGRDDAAALALAKAAFSLGREEEGAELLAKAVMADHENPRLVSLAKKVLRDSGKEELAASIVDQAQKRVEAIVAEAGALMRQARFDESLVRLEEALQSMPDNTGVLLAAAQLHLLWMSQKGINLDYVARVNHYLSRLDVLIPGNERVTKMYRFMRETLSRAPKA